MSLGYSSSISVSLCSSIKGGAEAPFPTQQLVIEPVICSKMEKIKVPTTTDKGKTNAIRPLPLAKCTILPEGAYILDGPCPISEVKLTKAFPLAFYFGT